MGASCSSPQADFPPLPPRVSPTAPCRAVGAPVFEITRIPLADGLFEQAEVFSGSAAALNEDLLERLFSLRSSAGLLQRGFRLVLLPAFDTDTISLELIAADGQPLSISDAHALQAKPGVAACDARLARCVEDLMTYFIEHVEDPTSALALSAQGTLVPRQSKRIDPAVASFNQAMLDMRSALGSSYILALHLHKSQAHGTPTVRARLLKPTTPSPTILGDAAAAAAGAPQQPSQQQQQLQRQQGSWEAVTLLDVAACSNSGQLHDAMHRVADASSQLAAALAAAEVYRQGTVTIVSPRFIALAGVGAPPPGAAAPARSGASTTGPTRSGASAAAVFPNAPAAPDYSTRSSPSAFTSPPARSATSAAFPARSGASASPSTTATGAAAAAPAFPARSVASTTTGAASAAAAAAAAAVRTLPAPRRALLARSVAALNAAVHVAVVAAAEARAAASLSAVLTAVLGELRERVLEAGGERALMAYKPSVQFAATPELALSFALDTGLGNVPGVRAFPDCLAQPVRQAWQHLCALLRQHNAVAAQLESLQRTAAGLEELARQRIASAEEDAAAAKLSPAVSAAAAKALVRNHEELKACCVGTVEAMGVTLRALAAEMAEAAQLASVQCGLMSPLAWSINLDAPAASPRILKPSRSLAAVGGRSHRSTGNGYDAAAVVSFSASSAPSSPNRRHRGGSVPEASGTAAAAAGHYGRAASGAVTRFRDKQATAAARADGASAPTSPSRLGTRAVSPPLVLVSPPGSLVEPIAGDLCFDDAPGSERGSAPGGAMADALSPDMVAARQDPRAGADARLRARPRAVAMVLSAAGAGAAAGGVGASPRSAPTRSVSVRSRGGGGGNAEEALSGCSAFLDSEGEAEEPSRTISRALSRAIARTASRTQSRAVSRTQSRTVSRAPSRTVSRTVSRTASRAPSRTASRGPSRAPSQSNLAAGNGGWVPLEGSGGGAEDGEARAASPDISPRAKARRGAAAQKQPPSPPQPPQPPPPPPPQQQQQQQQQPPKLRPNESLADAYARSALAHLQGL